MALRGIKVIEMAGLAPGPLAGMILADFGASVTRIDRPGQLPMDTLTRGKRSLCVQLKAEEGISIVQKLCANADVLIDPYRPGVMEKLGLAPTHLLELNPRLVYARLTGYGQSGPLSQRAGHDINYLAISGVLSMLGRHGANPHPPVNLLADFAGGSMMCVMGILMALHERFASGKGQVVDVAMTNGVQYLASFLKSGRKIGLFHGEKGTDLLDGGAHFYDTYKTLDGKYMSVGAIEPQFYSRFLEGLGLSEVTDMQSQMDKDEWVSNKKLVADRFATKTRDEWTKIFADLDGCVEPVLEMDEAIHHPQNQHRGCYGNNEDNLPSPEPRLSNSPNKVEDYRFLEAGENTIQILKENGYTEKEVTELLKNSVVYQCERSISKL